MSQGQGDSMSRIPQGVANIWGRCPIHGQQSSGVELLGPSQPQVIQMLAYSSSGPVYKQTGTKGSQYLSLDLRQRASGEDALKERQPKRLRYAFPSPNIIQLVLGMLVR